VDFVDGTDYGEVRQYCIDACKGVVNRLRQFSEEWKKAKSQGYSREIRIRLTIGHDIVDASMSRWCHYVRYPQGLPQTIMHSYLVFRNTLK
jgi:hypothetical protein